MSMRRPRLRSPAPLPGPWWVVGVAGAIAFSLFSIDLVAQTFRTSVDLIAVDVQVTDRSGNAVAGLLPASFEVTLDGRKRRVTSATFTQHALTPLPVRVPERYGLGRPDASTSADTILGPPPREGGRTFIISIDTLSFRTLDARPAVLAAQRFVEQLAADDAVGVFTLPNGPFLEPSTNHLTAKQAIGRVVGQKEAVSQEFSLSLEEVIDYTALAATNSLLESRRQASQKLQELDVNGDKMTCGANVTLCTETALLEAEAQAHRLEEDVLRGLSGLDALLRLLQGMPGRKTVLLLSGGMPISDRTDGRPRVGTEIKRLGDQAAYANATIHSLFFDQEIDAAFAAESRKTRVSTSRTRAIYTRALAEFSHPSGGSVRDVSTGAGEDEVDRLLKQLSSYYLLGVEPEDRDRDGRPHRLEVKVPGQKINIRSRQLVIVPKGRS